VSCCFHGGGLRRSSSFDDDAVNSSQFLCNQGSNLKHVLKTVRVFLLDLLELDLWICARELDVFLSWWLLPLCRGVLLDAYITSTELLSEFHLETLGSSDDDLAATILSKHLGKTILL
jgi:hypothetical protein